MPSALWYREIHERLLSEDPTAPAELVEEALGPLTRFLEKKYPRLNDPTFVADAVTDAVIEYLKKPGRFDPTRRGLFGYLKMAAERDLQNALDKHQRRDQGAEDVEVAAAAGKIVVEPPDVVAELHIQDVRKGVDGLFGDVKDRQMVEFILNGERSTEAFAVVLGLEGLPIGKQRSEVKRHKDRLKKRLKDYGKRIRNERE